MAKNRIKTSFTLSAECIEGLRHLSKINQRSMSNMFEKLIADKLTERKDEFFAHIDKRQKK